MKCKQPKEAQEALVIQANDKRMKSNKIFFFLIIIALAACTNVRKVQVLQSVISNVDSNVNAKTKIDSSVIIKDIFETAKAKKINFNSLNARIKFDFESPKNADTYIVNLSLQKDSAAYVIVRGALGVIGLKAIIQKDSIFLYFPLSQKTEKRSLSYLSEIAKLPFNFTSVQDLLVGNPIFLDSLIFISYKWKETDLQISTLGKMLKAMAVLSKSNHFVYVKLDDLNPNSNRTCDVRWDNFVENAGRAFPTYRELVVGGQTNLTLKMDYKEFNFDEPLKYTFVIPKSGKRTKNNAKKS